MLVSLTVSNFTVVKHLTLAFHRGFSAVTGETGAGKSITMDALSLCLGERADPKKVRRDEKMARISAEFDTEKLPDAQKYLAEHGFDNNDECLVQRTVSSQGRSKAFINGHPATLSQLQGLGQHLASICGQHTQYALTKQSKQRELLDQYGQYPLLLEAMKLSHNTYCDSKSAYETLLSAQKERDDRLQLLTFQVEELDEFSPEEGEFHQLEQELKVLSNGQTLLSDGQRQLHQLCDGEEFNVTDQLSSIARGVEDLAGMDSSLASLAENINASLLEIEEAGSELRRYVDNLLLDPERLSEVESRFSTFNELARKYRTKPEQLFEYHASLLDELKKIKGSSEQLDELKNKMDEHLELMQSAANDLHDARASAAKQISTEITQEMPSLGMEHGQCEFKINAGSLDNINENGYDTVALLIQTNPGEELGELSKVASGGELSRISLILQLAIAQKHTTPTLIFDEVDVGISGPTASVVGKMLNTLGRNTQVISITHLAQVASRAEQHYYVNKNTDTGRTETEMVLLSPDGRVDEVARLVGGEKTDEKARENARALLNNGESLTWKASLAPS